MWYCEWVQRFLSLLLILAVGIVIGYSAASKKVVEIVEPQNVYKSVQAEGFTFEVPTTWSIYRAGDIEIPSDKLSQVLISVGQDDVSFGDTNWTQVDFSFSQGNIVQSLVDQAKKESLSNTFSKEIIDGLSVDIQTVPFDNGQVTKAGSGGKVYYISLLEGKVTANAFPVRTMVITKQAKGDEIFESEFDYLIKSIKFGKL